MVSKRKVLGALMIVISVFSLCSCGKDMPEKSSVSGFYFDTVISLTFYGENAKKAADSCLEKAAYYDGLLNKSIESSDIYRINHSKGETVIVSEETAELLSFCMDMSKESGGLFDPMIGALSSLWDFKSETHAVPDKEKIGEALKHINEDLLSIDGCKVTIKDDAASVDVGAVAKGFIADKIKETAIQEGIESGIINLGGNVLVIGSKPDSKPFIVGIKDPFWENGNPITVVDAIDTSVVTSGCYERYFEYEGELYHHILDTKTGYPVKNNLLSVSIIGPSSTVCDALSTILYIKGIDEGLEYIDDYEDYECIFITDDKSVIYSFD
jgi:thiamine biosynthesis lipoprotein